MTQPSEGTLTEQQLEEQQSAPESGEERRQAEMFSCVFPVVRQLANFIKGLPPGEIQGDAGMEKIARGAATQNPAAFFTHIDQIVDLPFAEELLTRAASAAPEAAIEHVDTYSAQPYAGKIIEAAMRAAAVSEEENTKKILFTHADLYKGEPWARELMFKALGKGRKGQGQREITNSAVKSLKKYEDQPYAEEIIRAVFAEGDGWEPFDDVYCYSHLPFAKDVLVTAAKRFPWGMFARLYNYIELPWVDEVILAAIHSDRMNENDWRNALNSSVRGVLLKKEFAEAVYSALAEKFPNLIFDSQGEIDSRPWGKRILRRVMNRAAIIDPAAAIGHHPAWNREGCYFSAVLDKALMSSQEWEEVLELSFRTLLQEKPSDVFSRLHILRDRPLAREVAVAASSRAPAEALAYINAYLKREKPSYIDEMLELAVRSAATGAPDAAVNHIPLFVDCPWAEGIMLQLTSVLPDSVIMALSHFTTKPWANEVMSKAMDQRAMDQRLLREEGAEAGSEAAG